MSNAPFAQLEAAMGQAIMAGLANAMLVPEGGVAVPAILSRPSVSAPIGGAGMQTREVQATCELSLLAADYARGTRCSVFYDDQLLLLAGEYEIRHRDDDLEAGMSRLDLELSPA